MRKIYISILLGIFVSLKAVAVQTPSAVKIKLYKMAVSASVLCTNPITVYTNDDPGLTDMAAGPTFGSVSLADGTYPCVIMEMSDTVHFTPSAAEGGCTIPATDPTIEICRANNAEAFQLADGTAGTCATGEQRIAIYLSTTVPSGSNSNSFIPPTVEGGTTKGINLASALIVAGAKTGTFVIDFTNKASCQSNTWELDAPVFSFR